MLSTKLALTFPCTFHNLFCANSMDFSAFMHDDVNRNYRRQEPLDSRFLICFVISCNIYFSRQMDCQAHLNEERNDESLCFKMSLQLCGMRDSQADDRPTTIRFSLRARFASGNPLVVHDIRIEILFVVSMHVVHAQCSYFLRILSIQSFIMAFFRPALRLIGQIVFQSSNLSIRFRFIMSKY